MKPGKYAIVLIVLFSLSLSSCSSPAQSALPSAQKYGETVQRLIDDIRKEAETESARRLSDAEIKENYGIPDELTEYGNDIFIKYNLFEKERIRGYVRVIGDSAIEIDEILWVGDTGTDAGYDIINEREEYRRYPHSDDLKIFVLAYGTSYMFSLPLDQLQRHMERRRNDLYNIYFEDGKIAFLVEQYLP